MPGRRPRGGDGRLSLCWRGFERIEAVSSPFDCTAFRVAWGADVHNGIGLARRWPGHPSPRSEARGFVPTFEWILLRPGAGTHRRDVPGFEWSHGWDIHIEAGTRFDFGLTLTVELHRRTSGCEAWISTSQPARVSTPSRPSRSKYTGARVVAEAGYSQHDRRDFRRKDSCFSSTCTGVEWARRLNRHPDIHAGMRVSADRSPTLTLEMHSPSSRFGGGISTRERAPYSITCSHSPSKYTAFQVSSEGRYPHRLHPLPAHQRAHAHRCWAALRVTCDQGLMPRDVENVLASRCPLRKKPCRA